ncbi:MAG: hypothetical protein JF599_03820 [Verrucomicrobia bacterium]|nr:hypothetical protein [Verrucomicrobiota bacterium]
MKFLRSLWQAGRWCTRKGCVLALWSLWLVLAAVFATQLCIFISHELTLPAPVRHFIEQRLAEKGVGLAFDRGTLDPSGHILLEEVSLSSASDSDVLVTARSVSAKLQPWMLIIGRLELEEVSASGLALHIPPMLSSSGRDETIVSDVDITVRPRGRILDIPHLTGRIAGLSLQADGSLRLPAASLTAAGAPSPVERLVPAYLQTCRQALALSARLAALESPELDVHLELAEDRIAIARATLRADGLLLPDIKGVSGGRIGAILLNTRIPFGGEFTGPIRVEGSLDSLDLPGLGSARGLRFNVIGLPPRTGQDFLPRRMDLQVASLHWRDLNAGPVSAKLTRQGDTLVNATLSFLFAGSPWEITTSLDPWQGSGHAKLDGRIDDALLKAAGGLAGHDLGALLQPAEPAPLNVSVTLLPGWKPALVEGRLHSGPVRVDGVPLDETGTEFTYENGRVLCDNLVLRQGESLAHGLYQMDTKTMDFRFLLTGGLRPLEISGWFHDWWPHFFNNFDFSKAVPQADVDVSGRWGSLEATRVFVQAEGEHTGLHGVEFDRVNTRIFVRPNWYDIMDFKVVRDSREAKGSFARLTDLEKDTWSSMQFSVESSLPLELITRMFSKEGTDLLAPYHFANAPLLRLIGHVESAAAPGGAHEHIDIGLQSTGAVAYHGFPLSDLAFNARLRDDEVDLPALSVVFAGGKAAGTARVWKQDNARRLSFDATLTGANLGEAIHALSPPDASASKEKEKKLTQRLEHGRLNLSLAAEGPYDDFYGFKGAGQAEITGAELGQLNLLGPLSELLRGTIFNFSSFSLDTARARFTVEGPRLRFDQLKVTGPTAALEAKGDYDLRDHQLDFKAWIHPFNESKTLVGNTFSFVLSPFSNVLEVKLEGSLTNPSWRFAYGPTSFLRTITGSEKTPAPAP